MIFACYNIMSNAATLHNWREPSSVSCGVPSQPPYLHLTLKLPEFSASLYRKFLLIVLHSFTEISSDFCNIYALKHHLQFSFLVNHDQVPAERTPSDKWWQVTPMPTKPRLMKQPISVAVMTRGVSILSIRKPKHISCIQEEVPLQPFPKRKLWLSKLHSLQCRVCINKTTSGLRNPEKHSARSLFAVFQGTLNSAYFRVDLPA